MGMLTYGAMAGVGGEYLKQSEEERTNEYQAIRDKRLSGLKKEEATHASELAAGREQSQRNYESSNYSFGYGENVVRGGEVVQTGGDRPTSSSTKPVDPAKRMLLMRNGDHTSLEQLRKEYETEYMKDRDDLGNPIMDPNAPSLIEYRNSVLDPKHALILEQIESGEIEPPEPAEKPGLVGRAVDFWANQLFGETEPEKEKGRGGMLTEDAEPAHKLIKPKSPLSLSAKDDPVQMYDELNAQGFDDETITNTIRYHFKDPTWEIPPDALK